MGEAVNLKVLVAGEANGPLVFSPEPLSFWGGYDSHSGEVIDRRHPLSGQILAGKVLVFPGSRGSSSGSGVLLEAIRRQTAPAAILTTEPDHILSLAALLAQELYGRTSPVAVALPAFFAWAEKHPFAHFSLEADGTFLALQANHLFIPDGEVEVVQAQPSDAATVIAVLSDAADWLRSRNIPTWNSESLAQSMPKAVERGEVYLAKLNGEVAATVSLQWSDEFFWGKTPDDAGYVHKLAVARAFAGKKLGWYLLKWAEAQIIARERPYVRLDCEKSNPTINDFYQKAGFEYRGEKSAPTFGVNLYEKLLKPIDRS